MKLFFIWFGSDLVPSIRNGCCEVKTCWENLQLESGKYGQLLEWNAENHMVFGLFMKYIQSVNFYLIEITIHFSAKLKFWIMSHSNFPQEIDILDWFREKAKTTWLLAYFTLLSDALICWMIFPFSIINLSFFKNFRFPPHPPPQKKFFFKSDLPFSAFLLISMS